MQKGVKHTIKTNSAYYLTLTVVDWVDVFTRKSHRDAVIESFKYCQKDKGLIIYAYCIMSNPSFEGFAILRWVSKKSNKTT